MLLIDLCCSCYVVHSRGVRVEGKLCYCCVFIVVVMLLLSCYYCYVVIAIDSYVIVGSA